MSDEASKVQVSVNLPQSLWERLQADVRGAGQAIIDALEAHLPPAADTAPAPEVQPEPDATVPEIQPDPAPEQPAP